MIAALSAAIRRNGLPLLVGGAAVGILVPPLAEATRPALLLLSALTMMVALLRVEPAAFAAVLRRPRLAVLILLWVTLGVPALVFAVLAPLFPAGSPWLVAPVLIAATPTVMSAAAFAILLGADAALLTVVAIPSNALAPVWLPAVASLMGVSASVDPLTMALRLALLVGSAFAGAFAIVKLVGRDRLRAQAPAVDTLLVVLVTLSAIPCMAGVGEALSARPLSFLLMFGYVLALNLALQAIGFLVFRRAPVGAALSAGLVTGTRNMVLLMAALTGSGNRDLELMVATGQLVLFLTPALVAPVYRRIRAAVASRRPDH